MYELVWNRSSLNPIKYYTKFLLRSITSLISCRFLLFSYLNSLSIISSYTDLFPYADLSICFLRTAPVRSVAVGSVARSKGVRPLQIDHYFGIFSSFKVAWVMNARYVLLKRRRPQPTPYSWRVIAPAKHHHVCLLYVVDGWNVRMYVRVIIFSFG